MCRKGGGARIKWKFASIKSKDHLDSLWILEDSANFLKTHSSRCHFPLPTIFLSFKMMHSKFWSIFMTKKKKIDSSVMKIILTCKSIGSGVLEVKDFNRNFLRVVFTTRWILLHAWSYSFIKLNFITQSRPKRKSVFFLWVWIGVRYDRIGKWTTRKGPCVFLWLVENDIAHKP